MTPYLKKQDIFVALVLIGIVMLLVVKIKNDNRELRRNFVLNCTDFSTRRIQNTCAKLQIDGFEERKPQLTQQFRTYCSCVVDVWQDSGLELKPDYYWNVILPESQHTDQTKKILNWMRTPMAKSGHAKCQAKASVHLNWIPAALAKKNADKKANIKATKNPPPKQTTTKTPPRP